MPRPFNVSDRLKDASDGIAKSDTLSSFLANPFFSGLLVAFMVLLIAQFMCDREPLTILFAAALSTSIYMFLYHNMIRHMYISPTVDDALSSMREVNETPINAEPVKAEPTKVA